MPARTLAVAGLAGLLLAGCGGTVRAGAAATVGHDRITDTDLRQVVERGLADPSAQQNVGTDRPAFERSTLARLIQHVVLEQAARDQHVTVDGAAVDASRARFAAQLGGDQALRTEALKAGISARDLPQVLRDAALRDALADHLVADLDVPQAALAQQYRADIAQYDQVHSAHILVKTQGLAVQLLARVKANPDSFADLAKRYSQDTSNKDAGGDLGFQGRGALEKSFETAIFGARPGSFVLARTSFGFHVIHVIERRTTTLQQATPALRRTLLAQPRQARLQSLLHKTAVALGVHVSPRYGRWQAASEDVVATPVCRDAVSSPSPRPSAAAQAPAAAPTGSPAC